MGVVVNGAERDAVIYRGVEYKGLIYRGVEYLTPVESVQFTFPAQQFFTNTVKWFITASGARNIAPPEWRNDPSNASVNVGSVEFRSNGRVEIRISGTGDLDLRSDWETGGQARFQAPGGLDITLMVNDTSQPYRWDSGITAQQFTSITRGTVTLTLSV